MLRKASFIHGKISPIFFLIGFVNMINICMSTPINVVGFVIPNTSYSVPSCVPHLSSRYIFVPSIKYQIIICRGEEINITFHDIFNKPLLTWYPNTLGEATFLQSSHVPVSKPIHQRHTWIHLWAMRSELSNEIGDG